MSKKRIFVLSPSGTGHVTPMCGLVSELCKHPNIECIFYGVSEHKVLIENTGAQFRLYANRNLADYVPPNYNPENKGAFFLGLINMSISSSFDLFPQLIKDFEADNPDLILHDPGMIIAKNLSEYMKQKGKEVKLMEFHPNFVMSVELIESVPGSIMFKNDLSTNIRMGYNNLKRAVFNWRFGLKQQNIPKKIFTEINDRVKIVAVFPELHPRIGDYDKNHKFVGSCVSEEIRNNDQVIDDPELKSLLDLFENKETNSGLKLILFSIGTLFNHYIEVHKAIIQAFNAFDKNPNRHFKLSDLRVIMATGEKSLNVLNESIKSGEIKLPENVLLRKRVPQLEILKRADLFITHCGMNSTSETIKYAVPIVGIPFEGDQPIVAHRMCNELETGIRINPGKLDIDEIGDAIDNVLRDEKYVKNIRELSKISANYNGKVEGARIVLEYLNIN